MTHRSRLCSVLVDVPARDHARATEFYTAAFGREMETGGEHGNYRWITDVTPGMQFMTQATGDETVRVHFDIETDDVEAEVARLTALGATELDRPEGVTWVIMRDPVGTTFCVVPVQLPDAFEAHATTWD